MLSYKSQVNFFLFLATGVSIPSSYTAHLAPLSSSKLYNEARSTKNEKSMETPYVVMFQAVNILSGTKAMADGRCGPQIQECWEFEHPRRDALLNAQGIMVILCLFQCLELTIS